MPTLSDYNCALTFFVAAEPRIDSPPIMFSTGLATLDQIAAAGVAGGAEDGKPATGVQVKSILLD